MRSIDLDDVPADTFIGESVKIGNRVAFVVSIKIIGTMNGEGYFQYRFTFHDDNGTTYGVGPRS